MTPLDGIDSKLRRAQVKINEVHTALDTIGVREAYAVRVDVDPEPSGLIRRFVAIKNDDIGPPDVSVQLLAGEIIYQLRSALDHLVHQLVILSGNAPKLENARRHQFPIFDTPDGYAARARGMIDGVTPAMAALIAGQQPYTRMPDAPYNDALWILQDLNNTDKHRLIPTVVIGIDGGDVFADGRRIGFVQSPDIVLKHERVFFSLTAERPDQEITAKLSCAVAFAQAMSPYGVTLSVAAQLANLARRVSKVIADFRPLFS